MTISENSSLFDNINVTPLVDVFLVLLIIFMVAASIVTERAVPVEVPEVSKAPELAPEKNVTLTIDQKGNIFVDGSDSPLAMGIQDPETRTQLEAQGIIQAVTQAKLENPNLVVVVRAHQSTQINKVMEVVDVAKNRGEAESVAIGVSPSK
jgi:biopolymer transport protein ExbD